MKIGFVMPGSHYILYGGKTAGGAEWQMVLLAREFARQGHEVTFLTANPGGKHRTKIDGMTVVPAFAPEDTGPLLFFRVWRRLRDTMDAFPVDVWIQRSASPLTGLMSRHAQKRKQRFVYMISNDTNVDGKYEAQANFRDRWLYQRGVKEADGIVAQTESQAARLDRRWGRAALILPSIVPPPPEPRPVVTPERVFWAATFQPHKRPHLVLDLARRAPDLDFAVAGNPWGTVSYGEQFEKNAREVPNVRLLGRLDRAGMDREYGRAVALLSTSEYEGVSNTFLEAWRYGLPVVTLEADPDEVICREGLGLHSDDTDRVIGQLRRYRDDPAERTSVADAARRYLKRHEPAAVVERFTRWLEAIGAPGNGAS